MSGETVPLPIALAPKFRNRMHLQEGLKLCRLPTRLLTGANIRLFDFEKALADMVEEAHDMGLCDNAINTLLIRTDAPPLPDSETHSSPAFCLKDRGTWKDLSSKRIFSEPELRTFLSPQNHFLLHLDQPNLQSKCVHARFLVTSGPYPITQVDLVTGVMHARAIDHMQPKLVYAGADCNVPNINQVRVGEGFPRSLLYPMLEEIGMVIKDAENLLLAPATLFGITPALTGETRTYYPGDYRRRQTHIMDYLLEPNYRN